MRQQKPFKLQLRDFRGTLYLPIADHGVGGRVTEQTDSFVLKYIYFFWCLECLKKNKLLGEALVDGSGDLMETNQMRVLSDNFFLFGLSVCRFCYVMFGFFLDKQENTESLSSLQDFIDSRLKLFKGPNKPSIIWAVDSKDSLI